MYQRYVNSVFMQAVHTVYQQLCSRLCVYGFVTTNKQAALCYRKDDPEESVLCYSRAVNQYCQVGRFATAARLELDIAGIYSDDR
jgi:Soluble NSF attachment protein, SNAP